MLDDSERMPLALIDSIRMLPSAVELRIICNTLDKCRVLELHLYEIPVDLRILVEVLNADLELLLRPFGMLHID